MFWNLRRCGDPRIASSGRPSWRSQSWCWSHTALLYSTKLCLSRLKGAIRAVSLCLCWTWSSLLPSSTGSHPSQNWDPCLRSHEEPPQSDRDDAPRVPRLIVRPRYNPHGHWIQSRIPRFKNHFLIRTCKLYNISNSFDILTEKISYHWN